MTSSLFEKPEQPKETAPDVRMHESWKAVLKDEFNKEYFKELARFVREEYAVRTVYPPAKYIFRALDFCPFDDVKVIILGQDPYHGRGQANGLCFAVDKGVSLPPSLQNIFKEIEDDTGKPPASRDGDLLHWAKQGVLLLNATLTVRAGAAGSHQHKGWEELTDAIVKALAERREHLVFLLWGRYAEEKGKWIDRARHLVLSAAHPSPYSAANGFFGCKHFSKTNEYLKMHGIKPIEW